MTILVMILSLIAKPLDKQDDEFKAIIAIYVLAIIADVSIITQIMKAFQEFSVR